ncbi:uncharacterized [Tachysurus ichikawai]
MSFSSRREKSSTVRSVYFSEIGHISRTQCSSGRFEVVSVAALMILSSAYYPRWMDQPAIFRRLMVL